MAQNIVVTVPVEYKVVPESLRKVAADLEKISQNQALSGNIRKQAQDALNFTRQKIKEYENSMSVGSKIKLVDAEKTAEDMRKTEEYLKSSIKRIQQSAKENSPVAELEKQLEDYRKRLATARKERSGARAVLEESTKFAFKDKTTGEEIKVPGLGNVRDLEKVIPKLQQLIFEREKNLKTQLANKKITEEQYEEEKKNIDIIKQAAREANKQDNIRLENKKKLEEFLRKEKLLEEKATKTEASIKTNNFQDVMTSIRNAISGTKEYGSTIDIANRSLMNQGKIVESNTKTLQNFQSNIMGTITRLFGFRAAFNFLRRTVRETITTVKELSQSFTEIAMVTTYTTKQVWDMKNEFVRIAQVTGMTLTEVSKMGVEFFRQGRSLSEVMKLTEAAGIAAKIAGISGADSIKYLTSAINGYQLSANQAMAVSDKFATLAAVSATDYEELAIALSKVAAQAYSAGVGMDNMLGFIAKALETTREAPENIGTAFKTIFARMSEIKDYGKTMEDGMDVNRVDKALKSIGVTLTDSAGQIRRLDEVLIEVGGQWKDLNKNQKAYIATALAGTRQQTRLLAVFEDFDRTMELAQASSNSLGASFAMQDKYYQSVQYSIDRLNIAWQTFTTNVVKSEAINFFYNTLTGIVENIDRVSASFNGFGIYLLAFSGGILGKVIKSLLQLSITAIGESAILKTKTQSYKNLTNAINDKNNASIKENLISTRTIMLSTGEIVADEGNVTSKTLLNAKLKETIILKLKLIAITAAYLAVVGLLVYAVMAYGNSINKIERQEKQFLETQKKLNSEAFNAKKSVDSVNSLINKYDELSNKAIKTAEDIAQIGEYAQQVQDIIGEKWGIVAINGELDKDSIARWAEEQKKITNKAWEDISDGMLGAYGSYKKAYEESGDALVESQAIAAEALRQYQKENKDATMSDFQEESAAVQKLFRDIAKSTVTVDIGMTINGEPFDPNNVDKMGEKTRKAFQKIANRELSLEDTVADSAAVAATAAAGAAVGAAMGSVVPVIGNITGAAFGAITGTIIAGTGAVLAAGIDSLHDMSAEAVAEEYKLYLQSKQDFDKLDWFNPDTWHWPWDESQRAKMKKDFEQMEADVAKAESQLATDVADMAKKIATVDFSTKTLGEQFSYLQQIGYFTNPEAAAKIKETVPEVENLVFVMDLLGDKFVEVKDKIKMSSSEINEWKKLIEELELPEDIAKNFLSDAIVNGAAAALNNFVRSSDAATLSLEKLNRIQTMIIDNLSKFSIQDLSFQANQLQSVYENIDKINNMLSGQEKFDLAFLNEMISSYPKLGEMIRQNGEISSENAKALASETKEQFITNLKYERALLQSKLDTVDAELAALKILREQAVNLYKGGETVQTAISQEELDKRVLAELKAQKELLDIKIKSGVTLTAEEQRYYTALTHGVSTYQTKVAEGAGITTEYIAQLDEAISKSESAATSLNDQITAIDTTIQWAQNYNPISDKAVENVDMYLSKMSRIRVLADALDDLNNTLSVLESQQQNLIGSDFIDNMDKQANIIEATNALLLEQNDAYKDAQNALLNNLNPALKSSIKIVDGQMYVTEDYLKLSGDQMEVVDELVDSWNGYSQSIQDNTSSYEENLKKIEEFNKKKLEIVDKTKQLVIEAIKSEYEERKDSAQKAFEEEKKWLEKRKALYEESFNEETYLNSLEELQKKRADIISRLASLEGSANVTEYQAVLEEKNSIDEEINNAISERNKEALLNRLDAEQNQLDEAQKANSDYYDEKINNIEELEARAIEIINSGVDQTLEYLKAHNPDYKAATAEGKEMMLSEWRDMVSQAVTIMSEIESNIPDLDPFISEIENTASALGDAAIAAAKLKKELQAIKDIGPISYNDEGTPETTTTTTGGRGTNNQLETETGIVGEGATNAALKAYYKKVMDENWAAYKAYKNAESYYLLEKSRVVKTPTKEWTDGYGSLFKTQNDAFTSLRDRSDSYTNMQRYEPGADQYIKAETEYKKYRTGGLANFTGLAMLHGTPSKPERVLSSVQTELFDRMVQSLENFSNPVTTNSTSNETISIGSISITTPQLNTNMDFNTAGKSLAKELKTALNERGLNLNKKR